VAGPGEAYGIFSRWLTIGQEAKLVEVTFALPPSHWVSVRGRRLQCFGGGASVDSLLWCGQPPREGNSEATCLPFSGKPSDALVKEGVFPAEERPHHVLVNVYRPGQGILTHTDVPFYVRLAILSLKSPALFYFRRPKAEESGCTPDTQLDRCSCNLDPSCLPRLMQTSYHSISEEDVAQGGGGRAWTTSRTP
jgi:alkylated DNA repair dioxygenase AlkB